MPDKEEKLKKKISERLERCILLRIVGVPKWVLKHEQYMLLRNRQGFLQRDPHTASTFKQRYLDEPVK